MKNKIEKYFNITNGIFWILFLIIILLYLPFIKSTIFKNNTLAEIEKEYLIEKNKVENTENKNKEEEQEDNNGQDTTNQSDNNISTIQWNWIDYENVHHKLKINVKNNDIANGINARENKSFSGDWNDLYNTLYKSSLPTLQPLISAMKASIKSNKLNYQEALDFVISSIQFIPYTLVVENNECPCTLFGIDFKDDCKPRRDNSGCCNNIRPGAVYSPTEFLIKKTGDCDTKSLFAYSILKKLGFDVAVIVGEVEGGLHAMVAVNLLSPPVITKYVKYNGKNYYPWEVTSGNSRLGDMRMWNSWRNWSVVLN